MYIYGLAEEGNFSPPGVLYMYIVHVDIKAVPQIILHSADNFCCYRYIRPIARNIENW